MAHRRGMEEACLKCGDEVEPPGLFGREGSGLSLYMNVKEEDPRWTRKREWLKVALLCLACSPAMIEEARQTKHPLRGVT